MSCKNILSLGQLFIKSEDIPERYSAVLCLELSLVTLPVDSGRSCIFGPSCKAIHSEEGGKEKEEKKKKKGKHPPPQCSSELSPLLWLAKQLVLIHLSPLLIKNKKCHSLLELQIHPAGSRAVRLLDLLRKFREGWGNAECCLLLGSLLIHVPCTDFSIAAWFHGVKYRQKAQNSSCLSLSKSHFSFYSQLTLRGGLALELTI